MFRTPRQWVTWTSTGSCAARSTATSARSPWSTLMAEQPRIPVTLSSSSVYPMGVAETFSMAEDLGYDGVEIMVTHRGETQQAAVLNEHSWRFGMPVVAI